MRERLRLGLAALLLLATLPFAACGEDPKETPAEAPAPERAREAADDLEELALSLEALAGAPWVQGSPLEELALEWRTRIRSRALVAARLAEDGAAQEELSRRVAALEEETASFATRLAPLRTAYDGDLPRVRSLFETLRLANEELARLEEAGVPTVETRARMGTLGESWREASRFWRASLAALLERGELDENQTHQLAIARGAMNRLTEEAGPTAQRLRQAALDLARLDNVAGNLDRRLEWARRVAAARRDSGAPDAEELGTALETFAGRGEALDAEARRARAELLDDEASSRRARVLEDLAALVRDINARFLPAAEAAGLGDR